MGLLEDRAASELGREVHIRAAEQLEVDAPRREGRLLEVVPEITDQEVPVEVRRRGAERIVLEPIGIECLHESTRDRLLVLARPQVAADRPDAEARQDQAPEAVRQAVLPDADRAVLTLPPRGLQRRDRDLQRLRLLARLRTRNRLEVEIDLDRSAVVALLVELDGERALVVRRGLRKQRRRTLLRLGVGQDRDRLLRIRNCACGQLVVGFRLVEPDADAREGLLALVADVAAEAALHDVAHLSLSQACGPAA